MAKLNIKSKDKVVVISGKDKGKQGEVAVALPRQNKVIVRGVNEVSKHRKPRNQQDVGGIIKQEAAIDVSNVMILCGKCDKATRVGYKMDDGNKIRICKKCGASLD